MRELNQLIMDFGYRKNYDENDFFVSKSNYYAFNIIKKWPNWEKRIINIYGEKFSGKTHLANILRIKSKPLYINAEKFSEKVLVDSKLYETIIIDDFDNNIEEKFFYSLFNLVDQDNKYLLINSKDSINSAKFLLPDMSSRAKLCLSVEIEKPDDELIFAIILKNFSDRQINLDKKIIEFIIKRINRSYSKIYEFIYKVDQFSLKKKKPININTIKEIL